MTTCWNILLKGAQIDTGNDESKHNCQDDYILEFSRYNLEAVIVPILEFNFRSLDQLADQIAQGTTKGLILTSPRVVTAIYEASKMLDSERPTSVLESFDPDLIFVVGHKTAQDCKTKLNCNHNIGSRESGDGLSLARYINSYVNEFIRSNKNDPEHIADAEVVLLYPKGSRADNTIENSLSENQNIVLKPIVVYDTKSIDNISASILGALQSVDDKLSGSEDLWLNLVFFSPSGVEGFSAISKAKLCGDIKARFGIAGNIKLSFSAIGKTTETALKRNNYEIFCVAKKPSSSALVEALLDRLER